MEAAITPAPEEVMDYCYRSLSDIHASIESQPHQYTEWFKIAFPKLEAYLQAST
jgi:isopentenyl-diphosphate delta-isomerase